MPINSGGFTASDSSVHINARWVAARDLMRLVGEALRPNVQLSAEDCANKSYLRLEWTGARATFQLEASVSVLDFPPHVFFTRYTGTSGLTLAGWTLDPIAWCSSGRARRDVIGHHASLIVPVVQGQLSLL